MENAEGTEAGIHDGGPVKYGVLGHRGMVGSAIIRALKEHVWIYEGDLRQPIDSFRPVDTLFVCAGRVGGIQANLDSPVDFLRDNLLIAINTMEWAKDHVGKVVYLGSSCIYPRDCPQPMHESMLLSGPLEPSNEGYALAKIAGIKLCEAYHKQYGKEYLALMPCNLYGRGDNFDPHTSHVIPALIRKFYEAKVSGAESVKIWGTGRPMREFMHVDDLAVAAIHLSECTTGLVNVGSGREQSILDTAKLIGEVVGYCGQIEADYSKPDGTPRKLLDLEKMRSYHTPEGRGLREGIADTYQWFCDRVAVASV